jgi:hypothetical protein
MYQPELGHPSCARGVVSQKSFISFNDFGLVTQFDTAVPEPSSMVLISLGLGLLALTLRRRRGCQSLRGDTVVVDQCRRGRGPFQFGAQKNSEGLSPDIERTMAHRGVRVLPAAIVNADTATALHLGL